MKKGQVLEQVEIASLGYGGVGVAHAPNGKKILVKGALPNSVVDIKIVQRKKSYLTAHIVHVHSVDKKRLDTEVKCPHYMFAYGDKKDALVEHKVGCGGCKLQVMSYPKQLEIKQDMIEQCFQSMKIDILPVIGSPKEFGYRNKIEFSFGKYLVKNTEETIGEEEKKFRIAEHRQLGFHRQGQFSKVVDVDQCYLISERMHTVYTYIKEQLMTSGLPVYDAKSHTGVLRHLVIREGVHTEHIMVNLSYASEKLTEKKAWKDAWRNILKTWKQDAFLQEQVTTFVLTENNGLADTVRGQDIVLETLWGEGRIFEELHIRQPSPPTPPSPLPPLPKGEKIRGELDSQDTIVTKFQISPFSFFQTNTLGAEVLFGTALQMLGEVKGNIIDLYCGSGTIGLTLLKAGIGKAVKGIDSVASAIRDAGENAKINGLHDQADFYCGRAEKILLGNSPSPQTPLPKGEGLDTLSWKSFLIGGDVVIIDPPREGLHPKVVTFLLDLYQQSSFRLLYISCNPTTMARDIALLVEGGYSIESIQPVDMFPQTHHVECIGILT